MHMGSLLKLYTLIVLYNEMFIDHKYIAIYIEKSVLQKLAQRNGVTMLLKMVLLLIN